MWHHAYGTSALSRLLVRPALDCTESRPLVSYAMYMLTWRAIASTTWQKLPSWFCKQHRIQEPTLVSAYRDGLSSKPWTQLGPIDWVWSIVSLDFWWGFTVLVNTLFSRPVQSRQSVPLLTGPAARQFNTWKSLRWRLNKSRCVFRIVAINLSYSVTEILYPHAWGVEYRFTIDRIPLDL